MLDLIAELEGVKDELTAAGVKAVTDPASLNVPGVWVTFDSLEAETLGGGHTMVTNLWLVVRDNAAALGKLQVLLDDVTSVCPADGLVTAETVSLPNDPTPLPAFKVPHHRIIEPTERSG